jgi:hypothetical protein
VLGSVKVRRQVAVEQIGPVLIGGANRVAQQEPQYPVTYVNWPARGVSAYAIPACICFPRRAGLIRVVRLRGYLGLAPSAAVLAIASPDPGPDCGDLTATGRAHRK